MLKKLCLCLRGGYRLDAQEENAREERAQREKREEERRAAAKLGRIRIPRNMAGWIPLQH